MEQSNYEDSEATVDVHFTDLTDSLVAWKVPVDVFAIENPLRVSNMEFTLLYTSRESYLGLTLMCASDIQIKDAFKDCIFI